MISIYCSNQHHRGELCEECSHLLDYAFQRIDRCVFGFDKPACKDCPVHCYSPKMREKVKEVMKFAGPRMIYKHPLMAIMHMLSFTPGGYLKSMLFERIYKYRSTMQESDL